MTTLMMMDASSSNDAAVLTTIAMTMTTVAAVYYAYVKLISKTDKTATPAADTGGGSRKQTTEVSHRPQREKQRPNTNGDHDDVWSQRRQCGVDPASMHRRVEAGGAKPSGSSYYYAHNDKAKGGYSDGLKMEDYTMNQPRLLSRGGNGKPPPPPMPPPSPRRSSDASVVTVKAGNTNNDKPSQRQQEQRRNNDDAAAASTIDIEHFYFDDPGNKADGIATIRIVQLPRRRPSQRQPQITNGEHQQQHSNNMISWNDANARHVECTLEGEEVLTVIVESHPTQPHQQDSDAMIRYRLYVPKLYGKVISVHSVDKGDKLLIQLTKKWSYLDYSNLKPWPRLSAKDPIKQKARRFRLMGYSTRGKPALPITKYLWDDDGETTTSAVSAVSAAAQQKQDKAYLLIEELPRRHNPNNMIGWSAANVSHVEATLQGDDGLWVEIETGHDVDYLLHIPKLYGKVSRVRPITKGNKRLKLELTKKWTYWDRSNLKAWPHPHQK